MLDKLYYIRKDQKGKDLVRFFGKIWSNFGLKSAPPQKYPLSVPDWFLAKWTFLSLFVTF